MGRPQRVRRSPIDPGSTLPERAIADSSFAISTSSAISLSVSTASQGGSTSSAISYRIDTAVTHPTGSGQEVSETIARYRPRSFLREVATCARAVVGACEPQRPERARALLFAAANLADFGLSIGLELEMAVLIAPSVIERFICAGCRDVSLPTRRTLQTNLRHLATSARASRDGRPFLASARSPLLSRRDLLLPRPVRQPADGAATSTVKRPDLPRGGAGLVGTELASGGCSSRVARNKLDFSGRVGVDETSARRDYVSLFMDLDERRVMFATEGRDADTVKAFAEDFTTHGGFRTPRSRRSAATSARHS